MEIDKILICNKCGDKIERTGECKCGNIVLSENHIISGNDYIDKTPQLLNG